MTVPGADAPIGVPDRRAEIRAEVGHDLLQDRVQALQVETRRDRSSRNRFAPAAVVGSAPLHVVVTALSGHVEVIDPERLALHRAQLERFDARVAREIAEGGDLLHDEPDDVAAREILLRSVTVERTRE